MIVSLLLLISMIVFPAAANVPVDFTPTWSYAGGSGPAVEPVIVDDMVIVALDGRTIVALNSGTGEVDWTAVLSEAPAGTMVVHDESLYVPGNHGTLMVLALSTGAAENAVILGNAPLLEPLLVNDSLVVGDHHGTVSILDLDSLAVQSTLVLAAGTTDALAIGTFAVFANRDGLITGLDVSAGEIAWQTMTAGSPGSLTAVDADVLLGTGGGDVFKLSAEDGSIDWRQSHGTSSMMDFTIAGPVVLGISTQGDLIALDPVSGEREWQGVLTTGGYFASDTCEPNCLVALMDGTLTSVSPLEEQIVAQGEAIQPLGIRPVSSDSVIVVVTRQGDVIAWGLPDQ